MLNEFDRTIISSLGGKILVGVDEAGRGPLAGPVVACACYVPEDLYQNETLLQINDSKKLSPKKREKLFAELTRLPVIYATGFATAREIDEINILQATFLAMRRALKKFDGKNIFAAIDGNRAIPQISCAQKTFIGGDGKSLAIATASVIAKVTRDNFMRVIDKQFPLYGFAGHKGYGCAAHIDAIKTYGPCPQHRKTFEPVLSLSGGLLCCNPARQSIMAKMPIIQEEAQKEEANV